MNNHYQTLGLTRDATDADIKKAYRKLAKEYHPDTNKAPGAEARFKEINEAHDVLKDGARRSQYDLQTSSPRHQGGSPRDFSWGSGPGFGQGSQVDLDEILRDIRRARTHFPDDAKNRDIVLNYNITLEEAFMGKEATARYNLAGKNSQELSFKITPGIADGMKLRFQGKGDDQIPNIPPGDLYIKISIMRHSNFIRMGHDLITSTNISYLDAILGVDREIPTIEGKRIVMRVPAGILPGQSLRATGKGMLDVSTGKRGDMMVEITFSTPQVSQEGRQKLQEIRSEIKS